MAWYHWLIVVIPFLIVLGLAFYSRRYIRDVVDFLAAGRVAGRYVICVASLESTLGIITLVAAMERFYKAGFAYGFWGGLLAPIWMILSLTGFFSYRFRETRAMTLGQYLEARYSKNFRIFGTSLRTLSEMLTNMICPAVAARFFIYLFGWPTKLEILGCTIDTFSVVMLFSLLFALTVIWAGGQIALIVTDAIQGIFCYPIFVILTVYILFHFSWFREITPTLADRAVGESFLNPFDVHELRDFNLFAIIVALFGGFLNRGSWAGGGADTAAKTAHEQKMADILGAWRGGFSGIVQMLLAVALITFMTHATFAKPARETRIQLSQQIVSEQHSSSPVLQKKLMTAVESLPEQHQHIGKDAPMSIKNNIDNRYFDAVGEVYRKELGDAQGNAQLLSFRTIFNQQMLQVAFRHIFPASIVALFALLGLLLMLSTDDSRIFSSARTISQDIILPFIKKPLTVKQHLWLIRWLTLFVCVCFFIGSQYLSQMEYITLYSVIMSSIWLGGAGPVMLGGLYTRFGTTVGAYASLIAGGGISALGVVLQRNWPDQIYPRLLEMGWVPYLDHALRTISSPLSPIVRWEMDAVKFPINSQEIFLIAMISGILSYVIGSLLTCRKPFNLDQLLHRGIYAIEGTKNLKTPWTWHTFLTKVIGITPEYTKGDRIIAWSVFLYSFVYGSLLGFGGVVIWNLISPWGNFGWGIQFFITGLLVPCIVGIVSTVWFMAGGIRDIHRLFRDLEQRKTDPTDDGSVPQQDKIPESGKN